MKWFIYVLISIVIILGTIILRLKIKKNHWQNNVDINLIQLPNYVVTLDSIDIPLSFFSKGVLFIKFYSSNCQLCESEIKMSLPLMEKNTSINFLFIELKESKINKSNNQIFWATNKENNNIFFLTANKEVVDAFNGSKESILYVYNNGQFVLRTKGFFTLKPIIERIANE
jgi:thiol-disulfide isomerase/thioredoxin